MGWYVELHIWLAYPSTLPPNILDFDDSQWITSVHAEVSQPLVFPRDLVVFYSSLVHICINILVHINIPMADSSTSTDNAYLWIVYSAIN